MEDKIFLKQAKRIFSSLKTDPNSVLLSEEQIDKRLLKKSKKSKYKKGHSIIKIYTFSWTPTKTPTRVDFVEKREIDRPTLYSFNGPFQLVHADVRNLEF